MQTKKITVHGHVQGVGFRWCTQNVAKELGIKGTVKNNADGTVTAVAQGEPLVLAEFISKVKASPSPSGRVDKIEVEEIEERPFRSFQIIY
ncbi:acylphosphatase [Lactobacillus sp. PV037]|uniref:acylphosphatase n=1 Tax=unclassified Lactobacillus TaxID=2620435 RepID=UPI00223FD17E|nr:MULTISPECIES: acylphosphatase [unclassified Lactobacillus]QNQ82008.1 acylphosphatase [Lactobacillus sp. PV012]QNQ83957.1 acylphosphatase [Lactobacillus sp. PV037]